MRKPIQQILIFSLIMVFCCFAATLLFTFPAFTSRLNLTSTGNIGSTIGGITAPVIGIITSIFLYLTLSRQIEANSEQRLKNESDIIFLLLNQLNNEINMFYYKVSKSSTEVKFTGIEALNEFARAFATFQSTNFSFKDFYQSGQVLIIIRSYKLIEERIKISNLSIEMKTLFQSKLLVFYDCILRYPLEQIVEQVDNSSFLKDEVTDEIQSFIKSKSTVQKRMVTNVTM